MKDRTILWVFLAFVVERLVEKLVKPLLQVAGQEQLMAYVALLLGCLFSVAFNVVLLTPIAVAVGLAPLVPWAGLLLSGLLVGGGSPGRKGGGQWRGLLCTGIYGPWCPALGPVCPWNDRRAHQGGESGSYRKGRS